MPRVHTHALDPQLSQVTVRFGDGAHSFLLREGATLTELANRIGLLGAQHDGAPISIDIEFKATRAGSMVQPRHPLTH